MSLSRGTQQLSEQDDPLNPRVASSALDFLLIELVPLAQRITEQVNAREQALIDEYKRSRIFNRTASKRPADKSASQQGSTEDTNAIAGITVTDGSVKDVAAAGGTGIGGDAETGTMTSIGFPAMSEKTREGVFFRLDGLGYRVGQGLAER